jgi:hypothetical protein
MIFEQPGSVFHARIDGFDTGLAGTVGVRILDSTGTAVVARTTAGIIENPAGSGSYLATLTAPSTPGDYTIFWDNGTVSPGTTSGEQLRVSWVSVAQAPPSGQFASSDDLATRLGVTFTDAEKQRADKLLADASALIQDEAGQKIGLVTNDVFEIPAITDDRITLPERPVVSVSSVTVDGTPLVEGSDWYLEGDTIIRLSSTLTIIDGTDSAAYPYGAGFGLPDQTLTVTYTHGYADGTIPGTVKAICLEAAVRVWVNPGSVARATVGNTTTTYDNNRFSPSGLLLTDREVRKIRRLFPRRIGSVNVGGV